MPAAITDQQTWVDVKGKKTNGFERRRIVWHFAYMKITWIKAKHWKEQIVCVVSKRNGREKQMGKKRKREKKYERNLKIYVQRAYKTCKEMMQLAESTLFSEQYNMRITKVITIQVRKLNITTMNSIRQHDDPSVEFIKIILKQKVNSIECLDKFCTTHKYTHNHSLAHSESHSRRLSPSE